MFDFLTNDDFWNAQIMKNSDVEDIKYQHKEITKIDETFVAVVVYFLFFPDYNVLTKVLSNTDVCFSMIGLFVKISK